MKIDVLITVARSFIAEELFKQKDRLPPDLRGPEIRLKQDDKRAWVYVWWPGATLGEYIQVAVPFELILDKGYRAPFEPVAEAADELIAKVVETWNTSSTSS